MTTTNASKRTFIDGVQTTGTSPGFLSIADVADGEDGIFEVHVQARNGVDGYWIVRGKISGGTSAAVIDGETTDIIFESSTGLDAKFNISTDTVRINCQGLAATTIDWECWVTYIIK